MNSTRSKLPNRSTVVRWTGTLLALVLLVYLLAHQGWQEIGEAISQISLWRLAAALGLMLLSRLAVSVRWFVLLRSSGMKVSLNQALQINFAGLFANNFLPTTIGGDVVRLAGAVQLKLDAAICTASLVVDRLIGMAGMAFAIPLGLPSFLQALPALKEAPAAMGMAYTPGKLATAGLAASPLGAWGKKAWEKGLNAAGKFTGALVLWLKQPLALLAALGLTWLHMACLFGFLSLLFAGMGQTISFSLVGGLYSIVYLFTLLPISINGYGVQETAMALIFAYAGGTSLASALTAALLFRTIMMLASLPGAVFVPGMMPGSRHQPVP